MKRKALFCNVLALSLIFSPLAPTFAKSVEFTEPQVETLDNQLQAKFFGYTKTKYYTSIEIGFENPTDQYIEFTPKEIFLDDDGKYSLPLMSKEEIMSIESRKPSNAIFPAILAGALGIAALGTSKGNKDVAWGLAMGAAGVGAAALATKGLEGRAKQSKLLLFEGNRLDVIDKIPPGMTLGGKLYFPPTKKPESVTLMVKTANGKYEKRNFPLIKEKRKRKS